MFIASKSIFTLAFAVLSQKAVAKMRTMAKIAQQWSGSFGSYCTTMRIFTEVFVTL